jgi:hypothetical protein
MRHRTPVPRALTVLGLTLATLGVTLAPPSVAAASAGSQSMTAKAAAAAPSAAKSDPAIAAVLQRIATRTQSPADIALIQSRPELAAMDTDPSQITFATTVDQGAPQEAGQVRMAGDTPQRNIANTIYCGWIEIRITAYTLLGFKLFAWTHHAGYCTDFETIRRWNGRYDRMAYADPTVEMLDRKVDYFSAMPTFQATSTMQRHLQQCVLKYGCWANWYPWSTIYIWPDGYFSYAWGVA